MVPLGVRCCLGESLSALKPHQPPEKQSGTKDEAENSHFDALLKNNGKEKKERKKLAAKIFSRPLPDVELELICQQRR